MDYTELLSIESSIRFGRPCIKGTRISVYDVLSWIASGLSIADIISDFPELNESQIKACLFYAADKEHKILVA